MSVDLIAVLATGLFSGGITCLAMQGGLFTTMLVKQQSAKVARSIVPVAAFFAGKLLSYSLLGFLLGLAGSFFQFSFQWQIILQIFVIILMVNTALGMITNYPLFQYFSIPSSEKIMHIIHGKKLTNGFFIPVSVGFATVLLPCGATQAMMALAVASGSPWVGAVILAVFVIGTIPVFSFVGVVTARMRAVFHLQFAKIAAISILLLAFFNLNNVLALTRNGWTFGVFARDAYCIVSICEDTLFGPPVSSENIVMSTSGYTPREFVVRAGTPVSLHLVNKSATGCTQSFTIPSLALHENVPVGQERDLTFIAPTKKGTLAFMCSMGMYVGKIHVI